jgi:hypothetical protein
MQEVNADERLGRPGSSYCWYITQGYAHILAERLVGQFRQMFGGSSDVCPHARLAFCAALQTQF